MHQGEGGRGGEFVPAISLNARMKRNSQGLQNEVEGRGGGGCQSFRECAVQSTCMVQFFLWHEVSAIKAHKWETHAQQAYITLNSSNLAGTIYKCFGAAAVSLVGMSVLRTSPPLDGSPRVVVVTIKLYEANPSGVVEPRDSRTDAVFGAHPTEVCFVMLD